MPIKPGKDEDQSEWMARCVPEMIGTGPDKRPQEQAVAACLEMWRGEHGGTKPKQVEVEPGESYADFMDRCGEELDDDDRCQLIWEDRGNKNSNNKMRHKTHAAPVQGMEFILSDESPDRMGDIIEVAGWDIRAFSKNPIALFSHRADFPIGKWSNVRVEGKELRGHLELAPEGTSPRIDEIRRLIDAGILKAVSVGFKEIESTPLNAKDPFFGGCRFTKQELVETSLVAVPANPNALAVAKSLKISPATLDFVFAKHGNGRVIAKRDGSPGKHAVTSSIPKRKGNTMPTLSQRIKDSEQRLLGDRDQLATHLDSLNDENVSDAEHEVSNELTARVAQEEKTLTMLREAEKRVAGNLGNLGNGGDGGEQRSSTSIAPRSNNSHPARSRPFGMRAPKAMEPIDMFWRSASLAYIAQVTRKPVDYLRQLYHGEDEAMKVVVDWMTRSATAPAMTNVSGWAAELVQQTTADFMEALLPVSVYPQLAAQGIGLSFGRYGRIAIPTRDAVPSLAGSFVGEGQPIPVRQGKFVAVLLTPRKMAVITSWTREVDEHSVPQIEGLLRQQILDDTARAIDSCLLDTMPATMIRPAGILNGVTAITAATGGGFNALVADLKALSGALLGATHGNVRRMLWLINPQQANSMGLTAAPGAGVFPFKAEVDAGRLLSWGIIKSATVPLGTIIVLDAADFVAVDDTGPRFEISDVATLHFEDTAPAQINAGETAANPVRSLWQTDSMALRLIMNVNWTIRRAGVVAYMQNVTW